MDGVDIDAVHIAISACPAVARVGSPSIAALTTYLPGRRIPGIRINPDSVEVEVVAVWESSVADIDAQVRRAVGSQIAGRRLDITIADIELPAVDTTPEPVSLSPAPKEVQAVTTGSSGLSLAPALPASGFPSESEL